jgi:hypothetical protein
MNLSILDIVCFKNDYVLGCQEKDKKMYRRLKLEKENKGILIAELRNL